MCDELKQRAILEYEDQERRQLRTERLVYKSNMWMIKKHMAKMFKILLIQIKVKRAVSNGGATIDLAVIGDLVFAVSIYHDSDLGALPVVQLLPSLDMLTPHYNVKSQDEYNPYAWRSRDIRSLADLGELLVHFKPKS